MNANEPDMSGLLYSQNTALKQVTIWLGVTLHIKNHRCATLQLFCHIYQAAVL